MLGHPSTEINQEVRIWKKDLTRRYILDEESATPGAESESDSDLNSHPDFTLFLPRPPPDGAGPCVGIWVSDPVNGLHGQRINNVGPMFIEKDRWKWI